MKINSHLQIIIQSMCGIVSISKVPARADLSRGTQWHLMCLLSVIFDESLITYAPLLSITHHLAITIPIR